MEEDICFTRVIYRRVAPLIWKVSDVSGLYGPAWRNGLARPMIGSCVHLFGDFYLQIKPLPKHRKDE